YHLYVLHQGQRFDRVRYFTTGAVCFRREESYKPLQRQWSFRMREIVCFGTLQEVRAFLEQSRRDIERIASALSIGLGWQQATDPFFDPMRNASFLMQKVDPVKMEMVFRDELAIGSMNLHRQHFGTAFQIERDGEPVHSACVAFGMERWLFALLQIFGTRYELWPLPLPVNS
ncbi:MAG: aminoacyl--tRNA ligase-related protein, partial [Acidobacteriota bacterium]